MMFLTGAFWACCPPGSTDVHSCEFTRDLPSALRGVIRRRGRLKVSSASIPAGELIQFDIRAFELLALDDQLRHAARVLTNFKFELNEYMAMVQNIERFWLQLVGLPHRV